MNVCVCVCVNVYVRVCVREKITRTKALAIVFIQTNTTARVNAVPHDPRCQPPIQSTYTYAQI